MMLKGLSDDAEGSENDDVEGTRDSVLCDDVEVTRDSVLCDDVEVTKRCVFVVCAGCCCGAMWTLFWPSVIRVVSLVLAVVTSALRRGRLWCLFWRFRLQTRGL